MKVTLGRHSSMNQDLNRLHREYERLGVEVSRLESRTTDAVFHRDVFSWTPYGLIRCEMGKPSRAGEPAEWFTAMRLDWIDLGNRPHNSTSELPTFEGADLMWIRDGRIAVIAEGRRTNRTGAHAVNRIVRGQGAETYRVILPEYHDQHLLGVANVINGGLFAYGGELMVYEKFKELDQRVIGWPAIRLPQDEYKMKGSNWVQVGEHVILNERCKETIRLLEHYCRPVPVSIESLLAHGGGVACATGILEP